MRMYIVLPRTSVSFSIFRSAFCRFASRASWVSMNMETAPPRDRRAPLHNRMDAYLVAAQNAGYFGKHPRLIDG